MKFKLLFALIALAAVTVSAQQQQYSITVSTNGFATIAFTNLKVFTTVSTLEGRFGRSWVPLQNFFTTQRVGRVTLPLPPGYSELRLRSLNISPGGGFRNLALSYGNLETVAGRGVPPPGTNANAWLGEYEGANATDVFLSNPRAAVADEAGNIFVVEKDSHAVDVIDTNGIIRTIVGTHQTNFVLLIQPFPATNAPVLNTPTGLFYSHGRLFILDAGNKQILKYTPSTNAPGFPHNKTNGLVQLWLVDTNITTNASGLWVSPDELKAYYADGTVLRRWELETGLAALTSDFIELSAVTVNPSGQIIVTDRGDHTVWRVNDTALTKTLEAGNYLPTGRSVGNARAVSLPGPSSIWYLPVGGYLLGLDYPPALERGARVWYIDEDDGAAPLVFGAPGVHDGDGEWFQKGRRRPKIGTVQSVSLSPSGDIIILESGFVRRINFLRHKP